MSDIFEKNFTYTEELCFIIGYVYDNLTTFGLQMKRVMIPFWLDPPHNNIGWSVQLGIIEEEVIYF